MVRHKVRLANLLAAALLVTAATVGGVADAPPAGAVSTSIVISQVYGGGGSLAPPFLNDYIELHNLSSSTVSLTGWSVQYASATGLIWTVTNLTGNIPAGGYYLVGEGGGGGGDPLPTPDATGTTAMSNTTGKVALLNTTTALSCASGCTSNPNVVDFVGYGPTASSFEGSGPTGATSATSAALRDGFGSADSDNNDADFTVGTPVPRNAATPVLAGVTGKVREVASAIPLPGVFVTALRTTDFTVAGGAVTDASGDFTAQLAPGSYFLYLMPPHGAHVSGFFGPPTTVTVTAASLTVANPTMAATRGRMSSDMTETGSGNPIPGVWGLALSTSLANTGATEVGVVANGSGHLILPGLQPGNHFVGFIDPTGAHATRFFPNSPDVPHSTPVSASAGVTTQVDMSLPAQVPVGTGATITGTITEQGTGTPLAGVFVVALQGANFSMARGAVTNSFGQYSLDVVAGPYHLAFVDSTGLHAMEWFDGQPSTGLESATAVSAPGVANATLDPNTGAIAGTLTDDVTTNPLPAAWAIAIGPNGPAGGTVTASNGTYTITGLAPGSYRCVFLDPLGGRTLEYYDNSADYNGSTPINVAAAATATANAALHHP